MGNEPKPFASLSSGLLARKGAARPAMRPQGFGQGGSGLEDLGWNDMGFEPPKPVDVTHEVVEHPRAHPTGLTPVHSPVHDQQAEIEQRFNAEDFDEDEVEECFGVSQLGNEDEEDEETEAEDNFASLGHSAEDEVAEEVEEPYAPLDQVDVDVEEDEIDETAELYEPEVEELSHPVSAVMIAPVLENPAPVVEVASPVVEISIPTQPRSAPSPRASAGTKAKAAFTLRLDPNRHLKLRLACAVDGRSAQQLVTDALDRLLERMPDLDGLAEKAKRRG